MLKIALTGGIGSGKSTVSKYFARLNIPIIDADEIVHELLAINANIYTKIIDRFGKNILNINKTLNRKKISKVIFHNIKERIWIERLIHPYVKKEISRQIKLYKTPYCIISIPLFFETKFPPKIDRILVIDCPKKTQISRINKRNNCSTSQAKMIIAAQIDRKNRLKLANDIIRNTGTTMELKEMVKKLHNYYLSLV